MQCCRVPPCLSERQICASFRIKLSSLFRFKLLMMTRFFVVVIVLFIGTVLATQRLSVNGPTITATPDVLPFSGSPAVIQWSGLRHLLLMISSPSIRRQQAILPTILVMFSYMLLLHGSRVMVSMP